MNSDRLAENTGTQLTCRKVAVEQMSKESDTHEHGDQVRTSASRTVEGTSTGTVVRSTGFSSTQLTSFDLTGMDRKPEGDEEQREMEGSRIETTFIRQTGKRAA